MAEHLWKNGTTAHAVFRMSADCDRLCRPGARGAGKSLLFSGGEERETRCTQPQLGAVCLAVVPDGFVSASIIAVLFTPGRPKSQLRYGALSRTFREYLTLPIIAVLSGVTAKLAQMPRDSASSIKANSLPSKTVEKGIFPGEKLFL